MKGHRIPEQDLQRALNEVRKVYADLSLRPVERNCLRVKECCHFKLTGRTPYLTKGEALLAAKELRATGRTQLPENATGACPLLDSKTGTCLIYDARPFGCRTHFCAMAGGPYARREVIDLIRRLEAVDAGLGGTGPRVLQSAIADALRELKS
ncbi:MAG TPA: YkgJ family cysteine cluster protein [Chthoniobacterales bacterium]|nr:YkgJ family cysteine cluster protein [Chthoniobacterales bacterium]